MLVKKVTKRYKIGKMNEKTFRPENLKKKDIFSHLDADAKDSLLTALKEYKGSILMVCHEREFYEALGAQIWDCSSFCR